MFPACEPLYQFFHKGETYKTDLKDFEQRIENEKPDFLFVITKWV